MADAERRPDHSHVVCLTRSEVIFCAALFVFGVGVSTVHEVLFGGGGTIRVLSTAVDATQGSLFWSVILLGLGRLGRYVYRGALRTRNHRPS